MRQLLCWLLGHERMTSGRAHRRCLRCGMDEKRRNLGHVSGWEEVTTRPLRAGARASPAAPATY